MIFMKFLKIRLIIEYFSRALKDLSTPNEFCFWIQKYKSNIKHYLVN